jgi:hypothetical protein
MGIIDEWQRNPPVPIQPGRSGRRHTTAGETQQGRAARAAPIQPARQLMVSMPIDARTDAFFRRVNGRPLQTFPEMAKPSGIDWSAFTSPDDEILDDDELEDACFDAGLDLSWDTHVVSHPSRPGHFYTITGMSMALNRSADGLRGWEEDGILPVSPFVHVIKGGGRRFYTRRQIMFTQLVAQDEGVARIDDDGRLRMRRVTAERARKFAKRLRDAWEVNDLLDDSHRPIE